MNINERNIPADKEEFINISNLIEVFWKNKVFIIFITVAMAFFMLVKTVYFSEDLYTSK